MGQEQRENHYIILVHGTFAQRKDAQPVWYFDDGAKDNFCKKLSCLLVGTELEGAVWRKCRVADWPFVWSGMNTHEARLKAAKDLYSLIKEIVVADQNARLHFVAHSHGGNVLLAALDMYLSELDWQARGVYIYLSHHRLDSDSDWQNRVKETLQVWARDRSSLAFERQKALIGELRSQLRSRDPRWEYHDSLLNRLRGPVDSIRERFVARWKGDPEWTRLGNVVFMGTPFLKKTWHRQPHIISRVGWALPLAIVGTLYFPGILLALVLIPYLLIAWPGLNPLHWYWIVRWGVSLSFVGGIIGWLPRMTSGRKVDTNLYFREYKTYAGMGNQQCVGNWLDPLIKSLVVYAGPIDEALLALSAEPLVYGNLFPVVERMVFMEPHESNDASDAAETPAELTQYLVYIAVLWLKRMLYRITERPLRPIRRLVTEKGAEVLTKILSSAAYGTRPEEMNGASIHASSSADVCQAFQETTWNVAKYLLGSRAERNTQTSHISKRYQFLWDKNELEERAQISPLWKRVSGQLPEIRKRYYSDSINSLTEQLMKTCIIIEEKEQELAGVIDLTHSTYYTNDVVIRGIADFLLNGYLAAEA
jgi:hypothetical protein